MIPNLLTLGNLACGLVAIVLLFDHDFGIVPYQAIGLLMVGAMAFDFADGFVARALKATSPIGKELDSLSDLVSFGVLPGMMVYLVLKMQMELPVPTVDGWHTTIVPAWKVALPFAGLLIPLFSAYRLAKFNIDTRQSYGFLGFPTPANALFFLSVFLIFMDGFFAAKPDQPRRYYTYSDFQFARFELNVDPFAVLFHPWVLVGLTLVFSILLVTEIPLLAMKFKDYTLKNNWPRYLLIVLSITLLAVLWFRAIPLIIVLYFLLSFIDTLTHKKA